MRAWLTIYLSLVPVSNGKGLIVLAVKPFFIKKTTKKKKKKETRRKNSKKTKTI